ncbi:MAG: antibiotic biosynthesis monooxygenase, partial [Methyloceanibacter sp.]
MTMLRVALFVRLQAKPGKEADVARFLESGLALANQEATTPIWFALRLGPATFGIFDAFADD